MTVDSLWKDIYQGWKVGLKLAGESSGVGDWRMMTFIMGDEANIEKMVNLEIVSKHNTNLGKTWKLSKEG